MGATARYWVKASLSTGKQRNLLASAGLACRMIDHAFTNMSVPVAAKTSNGQKFIGSSTASLSSGTFLLTAANGLHCYGICNQWDPSTTIHVAFKTTDGRYGTALISRNATGMSGIGIGMANDGTTFDFSMETQSAISNMDASRVEE